MIFQFAGRTPSHSAEPPEFRIPLPTTTLGQIGADGGTGATDLGGQPYASARAAGAALPEWGASRPRLTSLPDDYALLAAVNRGEFAINGFRDRDLQRLLYPSSKLLPDCERRRRSATVSRKLPMLRAHGPIQKVPKTYRHQLTNTGRLAISAVLTMSDTSMSLLNRSAA